MRSQNRLLTTIAYRLGGKATYALEGTIFVAGAAVQWLRDGLKLIAAAARNRTPRRQRSPATMASISCRPSPASARRIGTRDARGAIFGLTRDTGIAEIVRAALEAVCYQTRDLMQAMAD